MAEHGSSEGAEGICFERIVPLEYASIAREKAIAENPANASPFEAAAVRSKLWRPGRVLRVAFLDGVPEVQAKVRRYANEWTRYANIDFRFGDDADAEIRISFTQRGSWSALGTDALVEELFPKHTATMNYGWLTVDSTEAQYSRVVLHEFGHALGMIHEHQSPAEGIAWNKANVINDLSGPPNFWNEATIAFNVFDRYEATQTQFTAFDPESIMLYAFPKHWTLDGREFTQSSTLSETDKEFIRARYPGRAAL
jgi:hypothetical protein